MQRDSVDTLGYVAAWCATICGAALLLCQFIIWLER